MGIPTIETGVFGGILVGLIAAWAFNRFYKVQLPAYLGFFAGKRSVPIITAFAVIVAAVIMSFIWPPIGSAINAFSHWAVHGQPALAFTIYCIVERSLIPFGLHHVWNVPFFFQAGDFVGHLDEAALRAVGVDAIVKLPDHVIHLLTGLNADQYAAEMRGQLAKN
jgi:PTS system glucose-specific IIC component